MTNQTKVLIVIGLIIAIVIGFSLTQSNTPEAVTTGTSGAVSEAEMNEEGEAMVDEMDEDMMDATEVGAGMMDEETMSDDMMDDEAVSAGTGAYLAYSPEAVAASDADSIILSFSATWCPSCRTLDTNINENLSSIPAGVEIYKVDYDTNVALRQQYGVTTQHTMVQVDSNGTQIQKWSGGSTLDSLIARI
jgi:thiol-disulfide isomerase/thioredoxin